MEITRDAMIQMLGAPPLWPFMGKKQHPIKDMVIQFPSQPSEDKSRGKPGRRPLRATKSLDENAFMGMLCRQPPKALHSLAENECRGKAGHQPPTATKCLEENVFMGQLGRQPPKVTRSLREDEFKDKLGRQPPISAKSLEGNAFIGQLGRHSGQYDLKDELGRHSGHNKLKDVTASQPRKQVAFSRLRRNSRFAQVGPEPEALVNGTSEAPQSSTHEVAKPTKTQDVSYDSQQTQPQVDCLLGILSKDGSPPIHPKRRPPSRASKSLDETVFMSQLGRQRIPDRVKKEDVRPIPPKRRPPSRASKSLDETVFMSQLGRQRIPDRVKKEDVRPIPPKRRPPSRTSKSLDENVFMSQLGRQGIPDRVKEENARPPIRQEAPPKVPLNLIDTLDLNEFRRSLGRQRNPYLRKEFETGSYKHGIDFKVLTIAESGPQPFTPSALIKKAMAA
jgi:hypothetical protein